MIQAFVSFSWIALFIALACIGCDRTPKGSTVPHDFTTPEGAILSLEDAYRARDIEEAVKCKDFVTESRLMLSKLNNKQLKDDDKLVQESARMLEASYRAQFRNHGFPLMSGVIS